MVRISDLIKGKTPPPASTSDDQGDGIRLRNIAEIRNLDTRASQPAVAPEKPEVVTTEQTETITPEKPPETLVEPPSEQKVAPPSDGQLAPDSRTVYFNAQTYLREVRENLIAKKQINLEQPLEMIGRMIAEPSLVDEMYQLTLEFGHGDDMYIASPVNSMIYSFKIGMRMGYDAVKLTEICLAALHHDIGMYLIPDHILRKDGKLTDAEFAAIKKHTEIGRSLVTGLNRPNVARAIYEHHERENGQGYPSHLKGDAICEYAKIIGICDSYEAMSHDRPHKKAAAQYVAVLQLAGSKDLLFPPHIVKMFLDVVTLYPIGSHVRLNNKAIGVVVVTNPNNPLKPIVRIVVDGQGKRTTEEKLINLAETNVLTIAAGVSGDALPA